MKIKTQIKRLLKIVIAGLLLHLIIIIGYGVLSQSKKSDLIVVLGSKVEENGIPAKRLQYRLNKGIELYQQGLGDKIIVSGGLGKEGFDEAEVMANYLIEKGIPSHQIIQDNQGINTFASALNSKAIIKVEGAESIIVVSQYFHLLRSKIAFSQMGIQNCSVESSDLFFELRDFYSLPREIIGIYYYLFRTYPE